jgi:hypothetical protein
VGKVRHGRVGLAALGLVAVGAVPALVLEPELVVLDELEDGISPDPKVSGLERNRWAQGKAGETCQGQNNVA